MDKIRDLTKAPSQYRVFLRLLGSGRTMTVSELAGELGMTSKATERAVAKLLEKDLIQRSPFRQRSYTCDSKDILLGMLLTLVDLQDRLEKKGF
ncbi:MAG: MarR family transcriptional regulator [Candidatus Bathyarchaeota archaeon]|nr:MarR family transcriptional regulator [Candidatus Bathyarchaeota archaeon]